MANTSEVEGSVSTSTTSPVYVRALICVLACASERASECLYVYMCTCVFVRMYLCAYACVHTRACVQTKGSEIYAYPCGGRNSKDNEYWKLNNGTIASMQSNTPFCVGTKVILTLTHPHPNRFAWAPRARARVTAQCSPTAARPRRASPSASRPRPDLVSHPAAPNP